MIPIDSEEAAEKYRVETANVFGVKSNGASGVTSANHS